MSYSFDELSEDLQRGARSADGCDCPTCGGFLKVYQRHITGAMVYALMLMDAEPPGEWIYVPRLLSRRAGSTVVARGGDYAKLRYWSLIEPRPGKRDDGSVRQGWWRVTADGHLFARDAVRVPRWAIEFREAVLGLEGDRIGIRDCIGAAFDYTAIMAEIVEPGADAETRKALDIFLRRLRAE
jgi:hypothetical protein